MEGGDCVESATLDRLHLSSLRWVKAVAGLHSGQVVSTLQRARCAMVREPQDCSTLFTPRTAFSSWFGLA